MKYVRDRQILYSITYICNPKKPSSYKPEVEQQLPEPGEWGNWGDVGQRVHNFRCKINMFGGSHVQYGDYSL